MRKYNKLLQVTPHQQQSNEILFMTQIQKVNFFKGGRKLLGLILEMTCLNKVVSLKVNIMID